MEALAPDFAIIIAQLSSIEPLIIFSASSVDFERTLSILASKLSFSSLPGRSSILPLLYISIKSLTLTFVLSMSLLILLFISSFRSTSSRPIVNPAVSRYFIPIAETLSMNSCAMSLPNSFSITSVSLPCSELIAFESMTPLISLPPFMTT